MKRIKKLPFTFSEDAQNRPLTDFHLLTFAHRLHKVDSTVVITMVDL